MEPKRSSWNQERKSMTNKRDISIVVAALDLYRDHLENDDHAPNLDQLPYTITDIKNLYEFLRLLDASFEENLGEK